MPQFPPALAVPVPFVGRDEAIDRANDHLERYGLVGITGAAGSGKSALAAVIAQRRKQPTVWVTLSEGGCDQIDELLWQLALPLLSAETTLLDDLNQMRQAGYALLVRLQVILSVYARQKADMLICIDQVEQAPSTALRSLLIGLCEYVVQNVDTRIAIILVGRALPIRLRPYTLPPLSGLLAADIAAWAPDLGLTLSPEQITQIVDQTGGLPSALQILRFTISESDGEILMPRIMAVREMRQLVISILGALPIEAQRTVADLAAHPERYTALSPKSLSQLEILEQQHLVSIAPDIVRLHPFLQSYYRQLLG